MMLWRMFPCESFKHIYAFQTDGGIVASKFRAALFVAFVEKATQGRCGLTLCRLGLEKRCGCLTQGGISLSLGN